MNRLATRPQTAHVANVLTIAQVGYAHWFFGNLYEAVVRVPDRLAMEYDPQPPFAAGSPRTADPRLVAQVQDAMRARLARREDLVRQAASALAERPASATGQSAARAG